MKITIQICLTFLFSTLMLQSYAQEWEVIETPLTTNLILYDMSFPAGQNEIGYTGGSDLTYNGKGTIYKSTDSGLTWDIIWQNDEKGSGVTSIYFFDTENGIAGRMDGLLMLTDDGGASWTNLDFDPAADQGTITAIKFFDAMNGVIKSQWEGFYTTKDGGASWTVATRNFYGAQTVTYADMNTLFSAGNDQRVYKSTDGGENWNEIYQGPNGNMQFINLGIGFYNDLIGMVSSEDGEYFRTFDGGTTWSVHQVPMQSGLLRDIHYITQDSAYLIGTPGAVYVTNDGGETWAIDSPVDFDPSYYHILFTEDGTGFVCGSRSTGGTILRKKTPVVIDKILDFRITEHKVFPNPTASETQLEFTLAKNSDLDFIIYDIEGNIVQQKSGAFASGVNRISIDLREPVKGNYVISVLENEQILLTTKFAIH